MRSKTTESIGFLVILAVWFIAYFSKIYNPLLVPSPIYVVKTLLAFGVDSNFLFNLLATFVRVILAFIVSALFGISLGLAVGHYKILNHATEQLIDFLRSIPAIVLFPLFILFFGVSDVSRLLVAIFIAVPIILINTKYGVINSSRLRKNLFKLYKLSKLKMFYKVILPEASPYIFTGLKVAVSLIIIIIIVTEMMLGTEYGLGQLLIKSQYEFETAVMFAIIITLGVLGFVLNIGFNKFEKKIFHWR